jgi:hypothetical protein
VEINQSYRAPSIPKLSTRNISSSVLRASSSISTTPTPRLRTSRFSFFGKKTESERSENIKVSVENVKIYTTLAETNQILVEIQKQLSLDYSTRIAEEKEILKRTKTAESKRKFAAKEKSVESVKKFGDFANNIVGKVTAPIKSVFDKIKDFFQLILLGIVTNTVFTWLGNEENRGKLSTIFDWVGKIFVGLLLTVIVGKFIKWGIRFFKLARWLWRLPGRLIKVVKGLLKIPGNILGALGIKPRGPSAGQGTAKGLQAASKALTPAQEAAKRKLAQEVADKGLKSKGAIIGGKYISVTAEESAKLLKKPNLLQKGMQAVGGFGEKLKSSLINPIINVVLPKLPLKVKTEIAEAVAKKGFQRFLPYVNVLFGTVEGIQRVLSGDIEGALLSFASAIPFAGWGALALDIYRSVNPEGYQKNIRFGMTSEEMNRAIGEGFNSLGSAMSAGGFSQGGTVPGKGSGFVDSVRAMLAPGEEVIKTTSSMLFRPLLKDINDNAGRLWTLFSQAVLKLIRVSDRQKEVSEQFSKVIKDFDRFVQNEIDKQMMSGRPLKDFFNTPPIVAGAPRLQTQSTKASFSRISMPPRSVSSSPQSSGGGINFIPMNLPAIQTPPPQIPTPQTTATDVPIISSVNMSNPYMQLTPEMYGIFV